MLFWVEAWFVDAAYQEFHQALYAGILILGVPAVSRHAGSVTGEMGGMQGGGGESVGHHYT